MKEECVPNDNRPKSSTITTEAAVALIIHMPEDDWQTMVEYHRAKGRLSRMYDDFTDIWHIGKTGLTLPQFLRMAPDEYQIWAISGKLP